VTVFRGSNHNLNRFRIQDSTTLESFLSQIQFHLNLIHEFRFKIQINFFRSDYISIWYSEFREEWYGFNVSCNISGIAINLFSIAYAFVEKKNSSGSSFLISKIMNTADENLKKLLPNGKIQHYILMNLNHFFNLNRFTIQNSKKMFGINLDSYSRGFELNCE